MSIDEFIELAKIENYEDDLVPDIYYEYQKMSESDIVRELPKNCKVTEEQLKELPDLKSKLEDALNAASEDALIGACYDKQMKAVQTYADNLVDLINKIPDGDAEAVKSISIDWKNDKVEIDFDAKIALSTTREIINGEGMFYYEDDNQFARVYDGMHSPARTVIQHLHYLLDGELINDIFGFSSRRVGNLEWECDYGDITDEIAKERIDEYLSQHQVAFLEGNLKFNVLRALELQNIREDALDEEKAADIKLSEHLETLTAAEKTEYEYIKRGGNEE